MLPQNNNFKITLARREDLPQILQIYDHARKFMRESGNASQWKDGFPPEDMLAEDIDAGQLYAVRDSKRGTVHGVFAFMTGEEPTYAYIERGKWLSDTEYGTLHRVAGDGKAHGIFDAIAKFCEQKISGGRGGASADLFGLCFVFLFLQALQRGADGGNYKGGKCAFLSPYRLFYLFDHVVRKANTFIGSGRDFGYSKFCHNIRLHRNTSAIQL